MGTKERKIREKERRRKEILVASRRLFWANGFDGTTIPCIAKSLELAPGTIYLYYPSKESLYLELLLEGYDILASRMKKDVVSDATPERRAELLLDTFLGFSREMPEYFDIIFFILQKEFGGIRKSGLDPAQLERLAQKENTCKKMVAEVLGALPKIKDTSTASPDVEAIWSMLAGVVFFWRNESTGKFQAVADSARRIILRYGQ